ncbi:MAG TPA: thioesterase domain-containing protein [Steroidobacteraceae bacterium]
MNLSATQLENRILSDIPLARHIGMRVVQFDGHTLVLSAPLAVNSNHKGTAFGGSLFSLAVLAGWGLITLKLAERGVEGELVIQESRVSYLLPVTGELVARASLPDDQALNRFLTAVDRYRKGRIRLNVSIEQGGRKAVRFEGTFALLSMTA